VEKLAEAIQQLQQCIVDLDLCAVPKTPQDVRDQREETARSAFERIKYLDMECKKLTDHSTQTYEKLTNNIELKALESDLQEVNYKAQNIQVQLNPLSVVERMKCSQEKCTTQQQIYTIQRRVMEVT
jgi:phage-related protein